MKRQQKDINAAAYSQMATKLSEGWVIMSARVKLGDTFGIQSVARRKTARGGYDVQVIAIGRTLAESLRKLAGGIRREWAAANARDDAENAGRSVNSSNGERIESHAAEK